VIESNGWDAFAEGDRVVARDQTEGRVIEVDPEPDCELAGRFVWVAFGDHVRGCRPYDLALPDKRQRWVKGRLETIHSVERSKS
jgi:hypothetical protein